MITIVDHAYEKENVLESNSRRLKAALDRGEQVKVYHPDGFVHGRLANIPGVHYEVLKALPMRRDGQAAPSRGRTRRTPPNALLTRLTTLQPYRMKYNGIRRGDIFIHWHYRDRSEDRLSLCEIFHLNMLRHYNVMDRVDAIHIRCATTANIETRAMREAISFLNCGQAKIDFRRVRQMDSWEHDSIKEAAEYAISTGHFVYYTHFKGVSRIEDPLFKDGARKGYEPLDIFYWSWLLYDGLFNAPGGSVAIGPLLRDGINKTYAEGKYDISWSALKGHLHHYSGSFQAFDGKALKGRLDKMGLSDYAIRLRKLWIKDRYTVEMFLGLMFPMEQVSTRHILGQLKNYRLYTEKRLPYRREMFSALYTCKDIDNIPPTPIKAKYAVITYCYGEHLLLREPAVRDPGVAYICVTDNRNFKAQANSAWTIIYDPWECFDGRFRHMNAKFRPFRYTEAEKALVIDSSIGIIKSVLPIFELECPGVLLKPHPIAHTIGEELPRWGKLRGMPSSDMSSFKRMLPLVNATINNRLYEGDVVLWRNCPAAIRFGESVLGLVECAGTNMPFMSNQLCMSALAGGWFKEVASPIAIPLPMCKYQHNTWTLCRTQPYIPQGTLK